ncbi:MAG: hypothetical protein CMI12_08475 [Oceanospirillum sp.]|nr:hypothetical protein [Oceanospirillum sp.]
MHESIFAQVNQRLEYPVHWLPLASKGTSNWLYQGSDHQQPLILRVNARDDLVFGVDRTCEQAVLSTIQPFPWSVQVIANEPKSGWCVMKHHGVGLEGSVLTCVMKLQLLNAVADCQSIMSPPAISYPDLFEHYQKALNRLSDAAPWLEKLSCLVEVFQALPAVQSCLTHHDLHPGNLCWQDEQLRIIDWEYAALGNPWLDAAMLHNSCALDSSILMTLPAFKQFSEADFLNALQQAAQVNRLLEQLWYRVRA